MRVPVMSVSPIVQLVEVLRNGCTASVVCVAPARPLARDRGEHARAALDRRALHVVQHAARAAHLLAATGATGAAVHQIGQRRAVAGVLLRTVRSSTSMRPW